MEIQSNQIPYIANWNDNRKELGQKKTKNLSTNSIKSKVFAKRKQTSIQRINWTILLKDKQPIKKQKNIRLFFTAGI